MSTTVPERRVDRASEHARTNIFLCVKVESTDKTEGEKKRAQKQTYIHLDAWVLRVGERCQVHQRCVANQVVVLDRLFEHGKMWKDSNLHVNTLSTKIKNLSPKTVFSDIDHDDGKKKRQRNRWEKTARWLCAYSSILFWSQCTCAECVAQH